MSIVCGTVIPFLVIILIILCIKYRNCLRISLTKQEQKQLDKQRQQKKTLLDGHQPNQQNPTPYEQQSKHPNNYSQHIKLHGYPFLNIKEII